MVIDGSVCYIILHSCLRSAFGVTFCVVVVYTQRMTINIGYAEQYISLYAHMAIILNMMLFMTQ